MTINGNGYTLSSSPDSAIDGIASQAGNTLNLIDLSINGFNRSHDLLPLSSENGGAVGVLSDNSVLTIKAENNNVVFSNNKAFYIGGALYNGGNNVTGYNNVMNLITENGHSITFLNNKAVAGNGGAIANVANLNIGDNVIFTGNQSNGVGGAISSENEGNVHIGDNVQFIGNNSPTFYGGAINNAALFEIADNALFDGNYAEDNGGAVYNQTGSSTMTIGDGATFSNNYTTNAAGWGGGAISNDTDASLHIGSDATFYNNHAAGYYGGAIFNQGALDIGGGATFNSNSSVYYGGAIMNYTDATLTIGSEATFANNNTGYYGGAIYNTNTVLNINAASGTTTFDNNSAAYSGAIFNNAGNTNITTNGGQIVFSNNTAQLGGAIYNLTTLNIAANNGDIVFENNTATATGGGAAIAQDSGATLNLTSSADGDIIFRNNINTVDGKNDLRSNIGNININGAAGDVFIGSGINSSAADANKKINKSGNGSLTLGVDSINANFLGVFTQTGGTTNAYGQFFNGASANNITNSTLNILSAGGQNIANLALNNAAVGTINNSIATHTITNFFAARANNFNIDIDGSGVSDGFVFTNASGDGIINVDKVNLLNAGALTAEIIDLPVFGGVVSGYTFTSSAGEVEAPAYVYGLASLQNEDPLKAGEYRLFRKGLSNTAKTILQMPALHLNLVKTGMNSLRKRLGDLRQDNPENKAGLWLRSYAKRLEIDDTINEKLNIYGTEIGFDIKTELDNSLLYAGVMGGFLYADGIKVRQTNDFNGTGHGSAPSAGAYLSLINANGWFADLAARYFWADVSMNNFSAQGTPIMYSVKRGFISGDLELGKRFRLKEWNNSEIGLEPKAEVLYAHSGSGDYNTNTGNNLSYKDTNSLSPRFAVAADYTHKGKKLVWKPFIELAVANEYFGETKLEYAGASFKSDISGLTIEGAAGLNLTLSDNLYVYGDVSYEKGKIYSAETAHLGVRFGFGKAGKKEQKEESYFPAPIIKKEITAKPKADVEPEEAKPVVVEEQNIATVNFGFNEISLDKDNDKKIREAVKTIKAFDYKKIIISGHTDDVGSLKANERVSLKRAQAAAGELEQAGIEKEKIEVKGEAYLKPIADNSTEEGRAKNRRVDIEAK